MRLTLPTGPGSAPEKGMFNQAEKKRLIMLSVLAVVVLAMFVYGLQKARSKGAEQVASRPEQAPPADLVVTPQVDLAALRTATRDRTAEERVLIEPAALDVAMKSARLLVDAHFEPMGGRELKGEVLAELHGDPAAARGSLLRARGWIETVRHFPSVSGSLEHYRGRLRLEGGDFAHFAVIGMPVSAESGSFVRLDGLFLKLFRERDDSGWVDAPLLVGPRAVTSYPAMGRLTSLPEGNFSDVTDDSSDGFTGLPFDEYWELVSYAQNVPEGAIDWSTAPLLDGQLLGRMAADGGGWRGKPVRLPPFEIMDIWESAQKENPLRTPRLTEGWLGSWDWVNNANVPVLRFVAPIRKGDLSKNDGATAYAFFLKNHVYEPRDGGVAIAPFFVVHSIDRFEPEEDGTFTVLLSIAGVSFIVLLGLIALMLLRDKRKSTELQLELQRRQRARRAKLQVPS